ncbi:DEAD/DEAH box helicase [Dictyocaulus viviparus]|uniref:Probable ATP-dependent RNA helicase DDX46 n=1 Tax=Dictyocaulus viviparus TaxID=29172 RepID=A0A0D8XNR1_DICVI|nr:DEAD/DEAH box helicase [Dictyocaulus viviparus]
MGKESRSDRDRDRERDKDRRERERRDRRKSKSREREKDRKRSRSRKKSDRQKEKDKRRDNEAEVGSELERIMEERRRKVEIWRARRNKANNAAEQAEKEEKGECSHICEDGKLEKKEWTLEDDDDDDLDEMTEDNVNSGSCSNGMNEISVDTKPTPAPEEDEEDPLDTFMSGLRKDLQKDRNSGSGVRVVTINATKEKEKGIVLENEGRSDFVVDDIDMEQVSNIYISVIFSDMDILPYFLITGCCKSMSQGTHTPEIARMTKAEVRAYREELDGIEVKGIKCPKPIKTWAQCGVEFKILQQLKRHNYTKPTSIQAQAIPCIMAGRDIIGIAKTGSGKTLAFLLPMFRHILDQPELEELDGPIAVIMSPTRELAMQTWKEANKFAKVLDIRVVCVYGGVGISEQIADLKRGAEVIVCTPGRMIDMLAANSGKVTNLRRVTYLVLDEADRMFDMGFEPQVMKIINNIRPDRQTVLFSATFPRQMEALARKILDKPIEIQVAADDIVAQLMRNGYSCAPLHGGIDQFDRDSTITDFKTGAIKILVATSVAARGLDVKNLILVVNYDCPNHYEDYVHRVGRTGRAGHKGYAYTFILPEHQERMAGEVCRAFETAGSKPPAELKAMFEKFKSEMAAQGKEVHLGGKGFAGSGYKYDEDEAEAEATKKKMTRLVCGMEHGADDDDELDEQLSMMIKSKRRVVEGQMSQSALKKNADVEDKVAKAKAMAEKLASLRNLNAPAEKDAAQKTAEAIMKGGDIAPIEMTSKMIAKQLADKLNEKLNYLGVGVKMREKLCVKPILVEMSRSCFDVFQHLGETLPTTIQEEEWQYFEEELDINDFPQQVRYRVCSRESLGHISEFADVGISVKGSHYPPGKEPKDGERKLYLLLEARHERNLKCAKEEIVRIMKDAFRQLTAQMQRGGPTGRYKVF